MGYAERVSVVFIVRMGVKHTLIDSDTYLKEAEMEPNEGSATRREAELRVASRLES